MAKKNTSKLIGSIMIDTIGALPTIMGAIGAPLTGALSFLGAEAFDIIWGPISAVLIYSMYKDSTMALIGAAEEIIPGTDIVPSATIAYFKNHG